MCGCCCIGIGSWNNIGWDCIGKGEFEMVGFVDIILVFLVVMVDISWVLDGCF